MVRRIHFAIYKLIRIAYAVAMHDAPPLSSHDDSTPLQPPPSAPTARAPKGKARAVPASTSDIPHAPPYSLRANKRRAEADPPSADLPVEPDDEEVTPRKSDAPSTSEVPLVQVDSGSPRPTRRAKTDSTLAIATGDVRFLVLISATIHSYHIQGMCGPCQKASKEDCRPRSAKRLATSCASCAQAKASCKDPRPSWARGLAAAIEGLGAFPSSVPLISSDLSTDASADQMSPAELTYNMRLLNHSMEKVLLYLDAMSAKQGIDASAIPGMDKPPPTRRSLSPSINSATTSSPQVGMSSLTLSDSRSNASSVSEKPGAQTSHISYSLLLTTI